MQDKTLRNYLLGAFGLAWPLQLLASWFAIKKGDASAFTLIMAASMFAPLAALLLARIPLKSLGWRLNLRGNIRRSSPLRIEPLATVNWMSSPSAAAVSTAMVE